MHKIDLSTFYPETLDFISVIESADSIQIKLSVKANKVTCPGCGSDCKWNYKTYHRKIIDLPMIGKQTELQIIVKQYECPNEDCEEKVLFTTIDGYTEPYRRMTKRCEDVVCAIALNMNCESASKICTLMGIPVSGDTIIRLLLRRYDELPEEKCSEIIGIDDWAVRKRQTYGTVICDGISHKPIELLNGRDGKELKEWLKENRHIKIITRDRASAYAEAISDTLPAIIQIADRFHLSNNLMNAVKTSMNSQLPSRIMIGESVENNNIQGNKKKEI